MSIDTILVIDESDSKLDIITNKLDMIIDKLNNNEVINLYRDHIKLLEDKISKLELELGQKNSRIERLEKIKSDFKIQTNTDSNIDNRLKQNLLLRQKKPFPFNHYLSYDYTFGKY